MLILTLCLFQRVRKAQESQKEMKLLLDMYKSAPKEQRDKVQLMAAERKSKAEVCSPVCRPAVRPRFLSLSLNVFCLCLMKQSNRRQNLLTHQGFLSG